MQQANAALAAKKYDDTARLLAQADALVPGDPQARALAAELQLRSGSVGFHGSQCGPVRRGVEGRQCRAGDEAIRQRHRSCGGCSPAESERSRGHRVIKEAQSGKASGDAEKKKQADYAAAIQAARSALTAKNYDVAIKNANDAQRLFPGDRTSADLANQAQAAKNAGEAAAMCGAQYDRQMAAGAAAMQGKRFKDAIIAYNEGASPGPRRSRRDQGLERRQDCRHAETSASASTRAGAPDYNKLMQTGQTFEQQKKWAEASAAFQQALKTKPGDAKATYGLDMAEGQRALDAKRWTDCAEMVRGCAAARAERCQRDGAAEAGEGDEVVE